MLVLNFEVLFRGPRPSCLCRKLFVSHLMLHCSKTIQISSLRIWEEPLIEQPMSSSLGYRCYSKLTPIPSCVQVEKRLWRVSFECCTLWSSCLITARLFLYHFYYYFGNIKIIKIRAKFWTVFPAWAPFSSCCQAQTRSACFFALFIWQIKTCCNVLPSSHGTWLVAVRFYYLCYSEVNSCQLIRILPLIVILAGVWSG